MSSGTSKPYLHFIGGNASDVTGSCTIVRFDKIKLTVDCGLVQTNNLVADYRANRDLVKRIKPKLIHGVIITHNHADHCALLLPCVAAGMQAHIYIPQGNYNLLKIMLEDSAKIMMQDSLQMQSKHGIKAPPLATMDDVGKVLDRVVEIPFNQPTEIVGGAMLTYIPAGHIVNSAQVVLDIKQGYVNKRLGFTGDINTEDKSKSVAPIQPLPRCNVVVGENTYNSPERCYSVKKDRWYDEQLIKTAIEQYNKILMPVFSLQRAEDILEVLAKIKPDCPVILDSPLACKIYRSWPELLDYEESLGLKLVSDWNESLTYQNSDGHMIILASSGMMAAGRVMAYAKQILPNPNNVILFCGYSSPNTLAYEIKNGSKQVKVDGEWVDNNAQIYNLKTFSSHANYNQLMQYYQEIAYDKLCLVHGNFENKVEFANTLQDKLGKQGKSSRVIAIRQDTKIYF